MDPITRQVGQHIEMEPEWEAAFTLQMKLTLVISMMQDWCALDVRSFWIVFPCEYVKGIKTLNIELNTNCIVRQWALLWESNFSEQAPIFSVFKHSFYGLIWPIHRMWLSLVKNIWKVWSQHYQVIIFKEDEVEERTLDLPNTAWL